MFHRNRNSQTTYRSPSSPTCSALTKSLSLLAAFSLLPGMVWSNERELLVSSSNISISSNAAILPVEVVQIDAQTGIRRGALADVYEAFGLRSIRGVVIGPDGDIFVAARLSSGGTDNEAQVLRYDGSTLDFESVFVAAMAGGLRAPEGITFGPDGHLYVASNSLNSVLRYDGNTGAFIDVFIAPGAGGLDSPYALAFGPDGNLYVTSAGTDAVLRYEPQGGNFLGVAAQVSNDGYISPRGVGFGPDGQLFVATITGTTPRFGIIAEYHPTNGSFIREFAELSQGLNATGEIIGDLGNDGAGNLLVGDVVGDMVRRFDPVTAEELGLAAADIERPRYFAIRNLNAMTIDSVLLTITGDGDNDPNAIYGQPFIAEAVDGLANFYIPGDVQFDSPSIRGVGTNGIVLHVGDDATIADGVRFDVAARQALAGPGGGGGGEPGQGGQPGDGGQWGSDNPPIVVRGCTGSAVLGLKHGDPGAGGCGGTGDQDVIFAGLDGNAGIAGNASLGFGELPLLDGTDGALPGEAGEAGTAGGDGGFGVNNTGFAALGGAPGSAGAAGAAGAAGGGGSPGSGAASSVIINAGDGGTGGTGSPGAPGEEGGRGTIAEVGAPGSHPYVEGSLSGGNGGGAGGGGGGGGGGGAGGNGGNGGGGGGGGATKVAVINAVLDGGEGGVGGLGGRGARGTRGGGGSDGAPGGGGGGALEIRVAGRLTVGESQFDASGAAGTFPNSGGDAPSPLAPSAGGSGGSPTEPEELAANDGGDGGTGGTGGRGGFGGRGGDGGTGGLSGPGAGGMISLRAAAIVGSTITVAANAGMRTEGSLPAADDGHIVLGSNVGYPVVDTTAGAPFEVRGTGDSNPFLSSGDVVSNIMNVTGGADVFGLSTLSEGSVPGIGGAPENAVAAIVRLDVGPTGYDDDYRDQDMILLVNLSDQAIDNPELGIGNGFRTRLLQRGFSNLPQFGGNGAQELSSLDAGAVYVTLVPDDAVVVNFRGTVNGTSHSVSDASLAKGDAAYSAPQQTGGNGGSTGGGGSGGGGGGALGLWSALPLLMAWMCRGLRRRRIT